MKMNKRIDILVLFFALLLCQSLSAAGKIRVGAERMDQLESLLRGKRIALVVNQTSVVGMNQVHLLDTLVADRYRVMKVFAPEHGLRGKEDAGATINNTKDEKTGVPVLSIYGKTKKPSAEDLRDVDVVVFDIQDVGARFYTYISTLHYVMEACAEQGKEMVVLDRPNPNDYVDGPMRKEGFQSFVGVDPLPLLHGVTVGELARMINGEHWLASKPDTCRLTVVKMEGWKHGDRFSLPVKPSPNLPNDIAIRLYPSLCFFEATNVSVGRGTTIPFQIIGYPDPNFGSFTFTPKSLPGFDTNPLQKDKLCYGEDLRGEHPDGLTLRYFLRFYEKSGKEKAFFFSRPTWFDSLAGSKQLRTQIVRGLTEQEIRASWQADLNKYKQIRKKYLLYPDYQNQFKNKKK